MGLSDTFQPYQKCPDCDGWGCALCKDGRGCALCKGLGEIPRDSIGPFPAEPAFNSHQAVAQAAKTIRMNKRCAKGELAAFRVFEIEDSTGLREFKERYRGHGYTHKTLIRRIKADSAYLDVVVGIARRINK